MTRKLVLGILAWLPITLVVALAIYLVVFLGQQLPPDGPPSNIDLANGEVQHFAIALFGGASLIAVLQILFSIVFIIDGSSKAKITGAPMALWALGFVFLGELVFPIYWLLYVAQDRVAPQPAPGHHPPYPAQHPHYGQGPAYGQGHGQPVVQQPTPPAQPRGRDIHGRARW